MFTRGLPAVSIMCTPSVTNTQGLEPDVMAYLRGTGLHTADLQELRSHG